MVSSYEPSRLPGYSKEEILAEIKRVASSEFAGVAPRPTEFRNSSARVNYVTVLDRFGTWAEAMKQAGLAYSGGAVSKTEIEADLKQALAANNGFCFTQDFYRKTGGRCHPKTILRLFCCNGWEYLMRHILGAKSAPPIVKPPKVKAPKGVFAPLSEDQLFGEMRRVWDSIGRQPTFAEFAKLSKIRRSVYCRVFGKWPSAILRFCTSSGYRPSSNCRQHANPADILEDVRKWLSRNPKATLLHKTYLETGGLYSKKTIRHHFKGWIQTLQHLGMSQNRAKQRHSDEELFLEIQRAWEMLGRQPNCSDMQRIGSRVSAVTIATRFDGWTKAIHAFCADRKKSDESDAGSSILPAEPQEKAVTPLKKANSEIGAEAPVGTPAARRRTPRAPALRLRFQVFIRDNSTCKICGRGPQTHPGLSLEPDHIIPYSKGGETVLENLQLLCRDCNAGKSDSILPNTGVHQEQQGPV